MKNFASYKFTVEETRKCYRYRNRQVLNISEENIRIQLEILNLNFLT